jgi:hypothetical protein
VFKLIAGALLVVLVAAVAATLWAHWRWSRAVDADIARLLAGAGESGDIVTPGRVAALPPPVQRYLANSGVVGKAIPRIVRLSQRGRIRSAPEAAWMQLAGDEVYSTRPPAFVWKAFFPGRRFPIVLGRDEYLDGQGSILMKALGFYSVADEAGNVAMNDASLMRYLNEMVWFPAAFAGSNVAWRGIDENSAEVTLTDRGRSATATMFFDADGRPENFRALRYNTATRRDEMWETPFTRHGSFGSVNVPTAGSAVWKLAAGDFIYIELEILGIEYE